MDIRAGQAFAVLTDETIRPSVQRLRIGALPIEDCSGWPGRQSLQPSMVRRCPRLDVILRDAGGSGKLCQHQWDIVFPPTVSRPVAIGVEGEIAVAQRNLAVEAGPVNIVPGHESLPVNGRRAER